MTVKDVVEIKEVADDLNDGKAFHEQRESGIGGYFWDSLLTDIESLFIHAGVHIREHGLCRMLSRRFPYAIYYEIVEGIACVIAVLLMHRNPAWPTSKLQERS